MDNRFSIVCDIRKRSKRSWINFKNAAQTELGIGGTFGTPKVRSSSISYLKRAIKESGMSAREILQEIEVQHLA